MGIRIPFSADLDKNLDWKALLMPKVIICSGKGGVGKTTITAALASERARLGKRVLVVSVDPAHSLGDSLCMDLSDGHIHPVPGFPMLFAQEPRISATSANGNSHSIQRNDIETTEDLQQLLGDVFLPVSEEMNVIQGITRTWQMLREKKIVVDEIYVDGSPSGHMLRALRFPFLMNDYLGRLGQFIDRFRRILVHDAKKRDMMKKRASMVKSFKSFMVLMSNPALATTVLVTIPETMAFAETKRTFDALVELGINVTNLVINKVHGRDSSARLSCSFCAERARNEAVVLQQIENSLGSKNLVITIVPLLNHEIRGPKGLTELGHYLLDRSSERPSNVNAKASCF